LTTFTTFVELTNFIFAPTLYNNILLLVDYQLDAYT